jgi:hypothetical protein
MTTLTGGTTTNAITTVAISRPIKPPKPPRRAGRLGGERL